MILFASLDTPNSFSCFLLFSAKRQPNDVGRKIIIIIDVVYFQGAKISCFSITILSRGLSLICSDPCEYRCCVGKCGVPGICDCSVLVVLQMLERIGQ